MNKLLLTLLLTTQTILGFAQGPIQGKDMMNWAKSDPFAQKVFIENKGQFMLSEKGKENILFSADIGHKIYFTPTGFICRMSQMESMSHEEEEAFEKAMKSVKGHREEEEEEHEREKKLPHNYDVTMEWVGANPGVQIVTEEKVNEYTNFLNPLDRTKSIEGAAGYKKMIYKGLYPGIDVVYTFHPEKGLKYAFVVHPGADASLIQMRYTGAGKIFIDKTGSVCYTTKAGNITDSAPETFYEEGNAPIVSNFELKKNVVTFNLSHYDKTKTVIIDPWMNSSLVPVCTVVEISADAANNVFIYGFTGTPGNNSSPLGHYIQKYNAAGVLQWTFNFTSAMKFIEATGDLAVDPQGNSFITSGFYSIGYFFADCAHAKLDPSGAMQYNFISPVLYENWRINFNCDYSQLLQIGVGATCCGIGQGDIINTATGAESGMFSPPSVGDIVTTSYGKNGKLYLISVKDASPNPHLTCLDPSSGFSTVFNNSFPVNAAFVDGFNTAYKTYGFNGIAAGCNYLYVCLGASLQKRDLNTGALLSSITVPGGVQHANSGTAVDKCGNVYVGSSNGVYVYDPNLSLLTSFTTPKPVLDIVIGNNGIFYACGGSLVSGTNSGFVAQFSMSTLCTPITTTFTPNSCGASNIGTATALPIFCAAPYSYAWSTNPVQTTQTATGLAGGTYTVIVTGAGSCNEIDTAVVTIPSGSLLAAVATPTNVLCNGGNTGAANAVPSGGTAPFTYSWSPGGQTSQTAVNLTAGIYSVTITDAGGCSGTQTVSITQPAALTATLSASPTTCGAMNGSASVSASGGTSPYSYSWSSSGYTTPGISNLSSGNYSATVTDANGCIVSGSANVAASSALIINAANTGPLCVGTNLNLSCNTGVSWNWVGPNSYTSNVQNPVLSNTQINMSGTYTVQVTDANGCQATATTTVVISPLPVPVAGNNGPLCANQTLSLNASGGTTYSWSGPGGFSSALQNPVVNPVNSGATGIYTVTVSNGNNCQATGTTSVTVYALPTVTASDVIVCSNGTINLSANGGVNYSWSGPNGFTSGQQNPTISNAGLNTAGAYVVTATDNNGCVNAAIAQVTINPPPVVLAGNNGPVCEGSVLNLTCNTAGVVSWLGPNNFTSNQQNPVINTTQPAAAGIYSVTVTIPGGCSGIATTTVVINPLPTSVSPLSASGCAPVCVNFANTSTVSGTCSWNFGDGTTSTDCDPVHCFKGEGTFNAVFTLTDKNGCKGTSVSTIIVYPVPHADFNATPQPTTILDPEIHFSNASSGAVIVSYNWTFGDQQGSNQQDPSHIYGEAGSYTTQLIVTSNHGCVDTVIKIINIEDDFEIFVPNAFTPNADGTNDIFMAKGVGIAEFELMLFDRWGNKIFVANDLYKGWDGTVHGEDVQQDVYVWKINLKTSKGLRKELSGVVSLIR